MLRLIQRAEVANVMRNEDEPSLGLRFAVILLMNLNIIDAFFTAYWISIGMKEANPIMAVFTENIPVFLLVKITIVSWGAVILWVFRTHKLSFLGAKWLVYIYLALSVFHVVLAVILYYPIIIHVLRGDPL